MDTTGIACALTLTVIGRMRSRTYAGTWPEVRRSPFALLYWIMFLGTGLPYCADASGAEEQPAGFGTERIATSATTASSNVSTTRIACGFFMNKVFNAVDEWNFDVRPANAPSLTDMDDIRRAEYVQRGVRYCFKCIYEKKGGTINKVKY